VEADPEERTEIPEEETSSLLTPPAALILRQEYRKWQP